MASVELPQTIPYQPLRMSVERYHELTAAGAFNEHDGVELLDGVVTEKMSKNPPHRFATRRCDLLLAEIIPPGWHVQNQEPVTLQNSEPEPDVAVIRGQLADYATRHPTNTEIELVVEVADTTVVTDRYKAELYAGAGIPTYWLINLVDRCVEVMTQPQMKGDKAMYSHRSIQQITDSLDVMIGGQSAGKLNVGEFFS